MNIIVFGATGMVGQGVLRECLAAPDVSLVQTVGRQSTGRQHARLREIAHLDLSNYTAIENQLAGFDACFYCLGIASAGMSEADYHRITYGFTMAAAQTLFRLNRSMTFVFVSGAGTDSSEQGRSMWARVKGKTENALGRLPFKAVYAFRPAIIQPLHGIKSKTASYRALYSALSPILPIARKLFPDSILTTEQIGRAMLAVARHGYAKTILESRDIRLAAASG